MSRSDRIIGVIHGRRGGRSPLAAVSVLLCGACGVWTVWALRQVKLSDADTVGVLAVGPGVIGAVLAGWGLWASRRGMTAQRTAEQAVAGLAQQVRGHRTGGLAGATAAEAVLTSAGSARWGSSTLCRPERPYISVEGAPALDGSGARLSVVQTTIPV